MERVNAVIRCLHFIGPTEIIALIRVDIGGARASREVISAGHEREIQRERPTENIICGRSIAAVHILRADIMCQLMRGRADGNRTFSAVFADI